MVQQLLIQCKCGKRLRWPDGVDRVRCPGCSRVLRRGAAKRPVAKTPPIPRANRKPPAADDSSSEQPPPTFIAHPKKKRKKKKNRATFQIDQSMLLYPWLSPTWIYWIGISFVMLTLCVISAITLMVGMIVAAFGALLSIFTVASMLVVCLAVASYVATTFISIIENTAQGDMRLTTLPALIWFEILPAFFTCLSASILSSFLAWLVTWPFQHYVPYDYQIMSPQFDPTLDLIAGLIEYQLFPVILMANLASGTWYPFPASVATVVRLLKNARSFLIFLLFANGLAFGCSAVLAIAIVIHWSVGLLFVGPVLATWMMYYAHWFGRVARDMID